jgi:hypothetical protein
VKYRLIALLPALLVALFAGACLLAGDRLPAVILVGNESGKIVSVLGAVAAALAFERQDYLRSAWLWYGACFVFLLVHDVLGLVTRQDPTWLIVGGSIVAIGNACAAWGTWKLATAWSVAGLVADDAVARRRLLMYAVAGLLSVLVTGWPLVADVRLLLAGDTGSLVAIASDVGDIVTLALVAPVLHTALAMRGGLLIWPWGLVTLSNLAWIVWDASSGLIALGHVGAAPVLIASESVRVLATSCTLAAGLAQRASVREVGQEAAV